jgi:hypothetical protein
MVLYWFWWVLEEEEISLTAEHNTGNGLQAEETKPDEGQRGSRGKAAKKFVAYLCKYLVNNT